jgi:hypothetical protein
MLQAAYEFLQKEQFADYRNVPFLKNAAIECFWLHARNLLEFLRQPKSSPDTGASVSARDFTTKFNHDPIGRCIEDEINKAFTHLQYGRKSQPQETLDAYTMLRVKEHIEREIAKFQRDLSDGCNKVWKPRSGPEQITVLDLAGATNATTFASLLLAFPQRTDRTN